MKYQPIEPKGNCPTCGAPDMFLTAANEWRDMAHTRSAEIGLLMGEVKEYQRLLSMLVSKSLSYAGEDHPASYRACLWCGLIESSSPDFHKPDCPVIAARKMLSKSGGAA